MYGSCPGNRRQHDYSAAISQSNFMDPFDSIFIRFPCGWNPPSLQPFPNTPDRMDPPPLPTQQHFHMRHLIMNKWENNLCHIKLYCFRFAIFMRPSWSPLDVFCSQSGAPVAPVDWQPYQNPQKLYWMSDRWVSKQNAGLLILVKWSNCF